MTLDPSVEDEGRPSTPRYCLGVIGGSGLYEIDGLTGRTELAVETPFGEPSDVLVKGRLGDTDLLFLPRHGRGHRVAPHAINYRANICALKISGATHLLTVSAVGSMRENIAPGDAVIPDQFIDLTKRRVSSFFDEGIVAHVGLADPVCESLGGALADAADAAGDGQSWRVHRGGVYLCMEGPGFSTRAESRLYRSWGVSVIGMTAMPEAKLAREAELPYAALALSTDYDCWHESEEDVSVDRVVAVMHRNVALARKTIAKVAARLPDPTRSAAHRALSGAIITSPSARGEEARKKLGWLLGPHLGDTPSSSSSSEPPPR
jgi:5'-methylthioadenosine phosphorylase